MISESSVIMVSLCIITKTCSCNLLKFSEAVKIEYFQMKIFDIFLIFAQNIDCGYTLEPPRHFGYSLEPPH